jgi:SPP1 gp7 family putative phage head morphogenesis protein
LEKLIDEMHDSVLYWLGAAYKANEPKIAQDKAIPATVLEVAIRKLAKRWLKRFDDAADALAEYFSQRMIDRSDNALKSILKKAGFTVKFRMTQAAKDVLQATVNQNVGLIKSIPQDYFNEVQGLVMRSVQTGRDLGQLTKDLTQRYDITKKRAALIARDQNNKATSAIHRARQVELGITQAIWRHSGGGKHPRPKHVAADGKKYDVNKGLPIGDQGQYVFPGEEINCRCVSISVIPGLN